MIATILRPGWIRLSGAVILVAFVLALAGMGTAGGRPTIPGKPTEVKVVTLTGSPATITEPGTVYDLDFAPGSAVSFTQQPGEVVTVTMTAAFDMPEPGSLFCDVHVAVNLDRPDAGYDATFTAMEQTFITQRGDVWWRMTHLGRDSTRTIPSPASATEHTLIGVAYMDDPGDGADQDCYGAEYGFPYQEVTASVRVSIVTMSNARS